jgi:hypothetical protein
MGYKAHAPERVILDFVVVAGVAVAAAGAAAGGVAGVGATAGSDTEAAGGGVASVLGDSCFFAHPDKTSVRPNSTAIPFLIVLSYLLATNDATVVVSIFRATISRISLNRLVNALFCSIGVCA